MSGVIVTKAMDVPSKHWEEHEGFAYDRRILIPKGAAQQCQVALYSIPPGKSAFPYHHHVKNEECYYILSGTGTLRTPEGEQTVSAGHFVFFPADETGAHKMTNPSQTEPLVYLDFDTVNDLEVCFYPDSGKIGVWGKSTDQLYKTSDQAEYYDGE